MSHPNMEPTWRAALLSSAAIVFGGAAWAESNHAAYIQPQPAYANPAVVMTDPQIDLLSPNGVTWGVVGESVTEHGTFENIERLMKAAKANGLPLFISPHRYYPSDHGWTFEGPLEKLMHSIGMSDRKGPYTFEGFKGSGSDFMPQYRDMILDGETVIASPHKVYGPEQNDLVLQLRKRGISKVILAGMSANLCTQAHCTSYWNRVSNVRWSEMLRRPPSCRKVTAIWRR